MQISQSIPFFDYLFEEDIHFYTDLFIAFQECALGKLFLFRLISTLRPLHQNLNEENLCVYCWVISIYFLKGPHQLFHSNTMPSLAVELFSLSSIFTQNTQPGIIYKKKDLLPRKQNRFGDFSQLEKIFFHRPPIHLHIANPYICPTLDQQVLKN